MSYDGAREFIGIVRPLASSVRTSVYSVAGWFSGGEQAFASLLGLGYLSLLVGSTLLVTDQKKVSPQISFKDSSKTNRPIKLSAGSESLGEDHVIRAFKSLQDVSGNEYYAKVKDTTELTRPDSTDPTLIKKIEELEAQVDSQKLILKRITLMLLVYVAILGAIIGKIFFDLL